MTHRTDSQIKEIMTDADTMTIADLCKKHKISSNTYYALKNAHEKPRAKNASTPRISFKGKKTESHTTNDVTAENARLKSLVVDLLLELRA